MKAKALIGAMMLAASAACGSADSTAPSAGSSTDAEPVGVSEIEIASLRRGEVRTTTVEVPSGYDLLDMNGRGDLLLGGAWLPKGARLPEPLPITGAFINDRRQILSSDLRRFDRGRVIELGSPCQPIAGRTCVAVEAAGQNEQGDVIASYRIRDPQCFFDDLPYIAVWRAATGTWRDRDGTLISGCGQETFRATAISESGWVAAVLTYPFQQSRLYAPDWSRRTLDLDVCPAPYRRTGVEASVTAVNDAGDAAGTLTCVRAGGGADRLGVRWRSSGTVDLFVGEPAALDNDGNAAGVFDGRAKVWLSDGLVIDLGNDSGEVVVRKFLKRGQVFGYVDSKPVIWRFGY